VLSDYLLAMFCDSQSRPSYRPSPEVAHVLWMYLQTNHSKNTDSMVRIIVGCAASIAQH
jgi:hypothetical protein